MSIPANNFKLDKIKGRKHSVIEAAWWRYLSIRYLIRSIFSGSRWISEHLREIVSSNICWILPVAEKSPSTAGDCEVSSSASIYCYRAKCQIIDSPNWKATWFMLNQLDWTDYSPAHFEPKRIAKIPVRSYICFDKRGFSWFWASSRAFYSRGRP